LKNQTGIKRLKAFGIDYLIILAYIGLLLGTALLISNIFQIKSDITNPLRAELIGFATLTLPVIIYFTILESSKHAGSIGKRKFGLRIVTVSSGKASTGQILLRNCIKFLPWELAHFFIYQIFYFDSLNKIIPEGIMGGLIIANAFALAYLLGIFLNKNNQTIYEIVSRTKVVQANT
jgi:uncharacterized RDD family membrane protein YckC